MDYLQIILRWVHFFSGVTWIGLLYYFNFVQAPTFAEFDANTKNQAIQKLVPRALLYFRMAALYTFIAGVLILGLKGHMGGMGYYSSSSGTCILAGSLLGTLMFLNVWLVIWPNQKIVIANANAVISGQPALADAAAAGARATLASRTNVLYSGPMLLLMGMSSHFAISEGSHLGLKWILILVITAALQFNALKGKLGPLTTVRGVIHCSAGLAAVMFAILAFV